MSAPPLATGTLPGVVSHRSVAERQTRGRAARSEVPRSSHAEWKAAPTRPDPIDLLEEQSARRIFCTAYADQNERDYAALLEAIRAGRLEAETGI
jgi:hypothetical protein